MRKVAAFRIYLSETEYIPAHIVEIIDSKVIALRKLSAEEAMTEWLPGALLLSNQNSASNDTVNNLANFYSGKKTDQAQDVHVWHAENIDYATGDIINGEITLIK